MLGEFGSISMGVLIFKGMKVGFLPGDFQISLDKSGNANSHAILSTAYIMSYLYG